MSTERPRSSSPAAQALRGGEVRGAGALAPAEAFDPRAFVTLLAPLVQLESLVDF